MSVAHLAGRASPAPAGGVVVGVAQLWIAAVGAGLAPPALPGAIAWS